VAALRPATEASGHRRDEVIAQFAGSHPGAEPPQTPGAQSPAKAPAMAYPPATQRHHVGN
jgi:hypothetical protein